MSKNLRDRYIGMENINNQGCLMKIIEYFNADNLTIQFSDNTIVYKKKLANFKSGKIRNPNLDYAKTEAQKVGSLNNTRVQNSYRAIAERYKIPEKGFVNYCKNILKDESLSKDEQALKYIEYLKTLEENNLKKKCRELGISYSAVRNYTRRHNVTVDIAINHYINKKEPRGKLKELCDKYNVNYNKARGIMYRNGLNIEEAIIHFRPDLYINIFGELVIPDKETIICY